MTTCLVVFLLALPVSMVLTLLVRWAAWRLGVVDQPDSFRKFHAKPVPRLGGVAIFLAFLAPVCTFYFLYRNTVSELLYEQPLQLAGLLAGGAVALGMGVADDVRGLPARWKLLLQVIAACLAFAAGVSIHTVSNPFGEPIALGLLSFPVTLFWFVACMNAINLLDGLDGLAAGISLFVTATLFLVALLFHNVSTMLLLSSLGGAILGFLIFNFHPASIFLGDSGSMFLGFAVGGLALLGSQKAEAAVALFIPIVALGLPVIDTSLAIVRRWAHRLPISSADRQHVHHVLMSWGLTQRQAVLILYVICVLLGGAALVVAAGHNETVVLVLGALAVMVFVCIRVLAGIRVSDLWGRVSEDFRRGQQSAKARVSVEEAIARMRTASTTGALWDAFATGLEGLNLDFAQFRILGTATCQPVTLTWSHEQDQHPGSHFTPDSWLACLRVQRNGHLFGELELGKNVHDGALLSNAPELVDLLRTEMAARLEHTVFGGTGGQ